MLRRLVILSAILGLCAASGLRAAPAASTAAKAASAGTSVKPAAAKRPRVVTVLSGFDLVDKDALKKQAMAAGASRGEGAAPVALAPHLGKLYDNLPEFYWSDAGGGGSYVFTLWDDNQKSLFHTEVKGYRFHYPETAPKLEPGKTYFWTVETPPSMSGNQQSAPVGFEVVAGDPRKAVADKLAAVKDTDAYAADLAKARIYTDARLWYDAVSAYTRLMQKYPARAELYEGRGTLFAQLPVTQGDADADFAQAEHLRASPSP
ncbi:MAG: DUF928 domain-containing protein [Bacillota bacterium]